MLRTFPRTRPATFTLILASGLVWAVTAGQSGSVSDSLLGSPLAAQWILWGPLLATEPLGLWRALGAMFLHVDVVHLAMNMVLLGYLGWRMERAMGSGVFTTAYIAGGVGAAALVCWFDPTTATAGASGAIYGLLAVLVVFVARRRGDLRIPLLLLAVNVGYTVLAPGVSFWGHVGGLFSGGMMAWWVTSPQRRTRWAGALLTLAAAGVILVVYVSFFPDLPAPHL
ncbi:MAG TPA: rhomboid family intramembrane serine protease [Corynebacterium sp.]|nr:rhomboid family intramembrane serine protease [Corynebacterium sp.]